MRKLVPLVWFKVFFSFALSMSVCISMAYAIDVKSCASYLVDTIDRSADVKLINVSASESKTEIVLKDPLNQNKWDNLGYPNEVVRTLVKVRELMDKAKSMHFITKSKYDHLLDDLEELSMGLDKKSKHATFIDLINKWSIFSIRLEAQIVSYEKLSPEDQKLYFEKMKLPISFMTSHFITFLETKHLKFNYKRLNSILKYMNELSSKEDLAFYLFEFEKQVLKFFSMKEFINCLA